MNKMKTTSNKTGFFERNPESDVLNIFMLSTPVDDRIDKVIKEISLSPAAVTF